MSLAKSIDKYLIKKTNQIIADNQAQTFKKTSCVEKKKHKSIKKVVYLADQSLRRDDIFDY